VNPLFSAALDLQHFFEARAWRFCVIGALAVQRWGEPRLTLDVDCTLLTGFGNEGHYIDTLLAAFMPRIEEARAFALANRVVLLYGTTKVPLDVTLGAMPFEELRRAGLLNVALIWQELRPLLALKEDSTSEERLRRLLRE